MSNAFGPLTLILSPGGERKMSFAVSPVSKGTEPPKFIADGMLGRLARWLRMLGFDTESVKGPYAHGLIARSLREGRIILTRSHAVSLRKSLRVVQIRSESFREQIREVLMSCGLGPRDFEPHSRCSLCNAVLEGVPKESVKGKVPEVVFAEKVRFSRCPSCGRIYWEGSHTPLFQKDLEAILKMK